MSDKVFDKMMKRMWTNKDYRLSYDTVRSALSRCPVVAVTMNDDMIRKTGIGEEMEIGGVPVERDSGDCELTVYAKGKSGCYIMMVYDRGWGAFRCAVSHTPGLNNAQFFKVEPDDIQEFLYEATMA